MLLIFALTTHLQLFEDYEDLLITMGGLYFFLPLMIINANEVWQVTMPLYMATQIYPLYRTAHIELFANSDFLAKSLIFALYHYVSLLIIVVITQRNRENLFLQKEKVITVKKEYKLILERLPEGILIIDAKNEVKLMNAELRKVLGVTEK